MKACIQKEETILPEGLVINVSLGAYPAHTPLRAMERAKNATEPLWGALAIQSVQICPQNRSVVDEQMIATLKALYPETEFRFHANAKVTDKHYSMASLSGFPKYRSYFRRMGELSQFAGAKAYSLHAGSKINIKWSMMDSFIRNLEEMFEVPVAVEGHYPIRENDTSMFFLSDWQSHRMMFENYDTKYVIDLSHFNIIRNKLGMTQSDYDLLRDMISHERCIEVHLSGNDGRADSHHLLDYKPWWFLLLSDINPKATVFTEGIQSR